MLLRVTNSWTWVEAAEPAELEWLSEFLTFKEPQRWKGNTPGRVRLLLPRGGQPAFPTGLLPVLAGGARRNGFAIELLDTRAPVPPALLEQLEHAPWNLTGRYSHQLEAIRAWLAGGPGLVQDPLPGRGIIWAPTASGKGRVAAAIAHAIEGKWLFAVHRGHLVEDVRDRWQNLTDTEAGLIGDGTWEPGERLTCATLQSLHAALSSRAPKFKKLAESITGLIIDEAHTAPAATFYATIQAFKEARLRVGLSGTPLDRGDKRSLVAVGALGPVVYRIKARDLQEKGVLAVPTVRVIPVYQRAPEHAHEWREVYEELVVHSDHRNGAILAAMRRSASEGELPGMVFVRSISHGRKLERMAAAAGLNVAFVSGDANLLRRKTACKQLESGHLDYIIATKVFTEGVNVPDLRVVVNAQGGKSVIDTLQQIGRGMRVTATKRTVTVWEFGDSGNGWMHKHAQERVRACQREGYACVVDETIWPKTA